MGLADTQSQSNRPLSIRAFADLASTSPRRIRRLIRQGRLRTIPTQSGEVRIPESELERLDGDKRNRLLKQSMEMQAIHTSVEFDDDDDEETALSGPIVPLQRHEAAMVRLGYLESELATTRKLLNDSTSRENDLKQRAEDAEQDAVSATVRAVEAEHNLEEMRTQVIDSTFRAMELEHEVKELRERLMEPWWKKLFATKKSED